MASRSSPNSSQHLGDLTKSDSPCCTASGDESELLATVAEKEEAARALGYREATYTI
jgi:hypothetical protein